MPFKKGKRKTGGRKAGSQNKFTSTVKETVLNVFQNLQTDPKHSLSAFAKKYPKDFYNIAAKLIPTEVTGKDGENLLPSVTIIVKDQKTKDALLNLK